MNGEHEINKRQQNSKELSKDFSNLSIEQWKKDISELIKHMEEIIKNIKSYDYKQFYDLFFPKQEDINFEKLLLDLKKIKKNLDSFKFIDFILEDKLFQYFDRILNFRNFFLIHNVEVSKIIKKEILKPVENRTYNIQMFNYFSALNDDFCKIIYSSIMRFEKNLRKNVASFLLSQTKSFETIFPNFLNDKSKDEKWKEIIKNNYQKNHKESWKILNNCTFNDLIILLTDLNKNSDSEKIFKSIIGNENFINWYKNSCAQDWKEFIKEFKEELNKINRLRNEVMHFGYILPREKIEDEILMTGIKSMNKCSFIKPTEPNYYLMLFNEIIGITNSFLSKFSNKTIFTFFQEKIFKFKMYDK
ncbi:MAG: hypothetical protein TYPL_4330 [Candidatus Tyloplasma litorale]|nr:MAG: hypothetical protein TYPL_4330 [Mycoplasmatales bacterium]